MSSPKWEVEQKFPAESLDAVARQMESLGAAAKGEVEQVDVYFAHPARSFEETDEALRLRRVDQRAFITYKGPKIDQETKTRREIELPLTGDEAIARWTELLEAVGFSPVAEVSKRRRGYHVPWRGREVEAALDDVRGVGTFVELELAADDEGLAAAREAIVSLAKELGLSESERRSYLELLLSRADQ